MAVSFTANSLPYAVLPTVICSSTAVVAKEKRQIERLRLYGEIIRSSKIYLLVLRGQSQWSQSHVSSLGAIHLCAPDP